MGMIDKYIHDKKLMLNKYNIKREIIKYDYSELKSYDDLKSCYIQFLDITDELIENLSTINSLEKISISNSEIISDKKFQNNFNWILLNNEPAKIYDLFENKQSVKTLTLDNIECVDVSMILCFENLEELNIYSSNVINISKITELKNIKNVCINGGNVDDEEFIKSIKTKLQIVYEKDYAKANELPEGM